MGKSSGGIRNAGKNPRKEKKEEIQYNVTVNDIFNDVKYLNPSINSFGMVESIQEQMSDSKMKELKKYLPENSLAYKIISNPILNSKGISKYGDIGLEKRRTDYTDKQLWVISYELQKNKSYSNNIGKKLFENRQKSLKKINESKAKLSANKSGSQSTLDFIKSNKAKLGDYYKWLNTRDNPYRKEYFNKKYSLESAKSFLNK